MTKRVVSKAVVAAKGKAKTAASAAVEAVPKKNAAKSAGRVNGVTRKKATAARGKSAGAGVRKKAVKTVAAKGVKKAEKAAPKAGRKKVGKSVAKKDVQARIWLTRNEALDALKKDGVSLSQKCLYANYGPSSSAPVRRKGDLWHYPELLERVKLNRNKSEIDYDSINKVSLARQAAELRIKEAKAEFEEIKLRRQAGELIEKVAVEQVLRTAAVELETNRKSMVADLTSRIINMLPQSCKKHEMDLGNVLERASRGWLEGLSGKFADMEVE